MARPRHLSTQSVIEIRHGWQVYLTALDSVADPAGLIALSETALPGEVPGTIVSALNAAGSSALKYASSDDFDVWYTCRFDASAVETDGAARLVFEGLATIADVWLNGESILHSENMFLRHEVDVTRRLQPDNELCIRFSALNRFLGMRRPRPRWRTKLVDHPQLRWVRTTLMGRMPGWHQWAHTIHAVGPWRPVLLVIDRVVAFTSADIQTNVEQETGVVRAVVRLRSLSEPVSSAVLHIGTHTEALTVTPDHENNFVLEGTLRIPAVHLWWPHTHGPQPLYEVFMELVAGGGEPVRMDFGSTGFRTVSVDQTSGAFAISVNDVPIFCRGACWTTADAARLTASNGVYDASLALARDGGMNMLRNTGNGFYESDAFYDKCAELGLMLWQDFAFALMDYPAQDPAFRESVAAEADQILDRLQLNPALLVLCGNSECESTAAMHGLSADQWANPLFEELLPEAARRSCPDVAFVQSSQWGGALPFHVDEGVSHYYGVGAYLRPPDDARRSGVRFATECLPFADIPEQETIDHFLAEGESPGQHPSWRASVPRNVGLGWDFGDVRDFYAKMLFGEDPAASRFGDTERYLALGRMVTGEIMTTAFAEWRRPESLCRGALVWFFRDLWPGTGWGVLDSFGRPKSAYFYLKRALAPVAVFFTDEGMSGLRVHVVNERPGPLEVNLRIALYRNGQVCTDEAVVPVSLGPRGSISLSVDAIVGHFTDSSYAYRFGPPAQDVTVASLEGGHESAPPPRAFFFPTGYRFPALADAGLVAEARAIDRGLYELTARAERFAQAVRIDVRGYIPSDNYFHLEPGHSHTVLLAPTGGPVARLPGGYLKPFNALAPTKIKILTDIS